VWSPRAGGAPSTARPNRGRGGTLPVTQPRLTLGERLRDLVLVGLVFILGGCVVVGYTTFRIWQVGQQDTRRHVDAIVVLGTAQYNGRPSPSFAARLDHAIALYEEGDAPYLITTGGKLPGDWTTEGEVGRKYAMAYAVPDAAILMETTGRSTLESMRNVRAIMDAKGLHTALFVSDRSHMLRVLRLAQDEGIQGWSSPTEISPDYNGPAMFRATLHELGATGLYLLVNQDTELPDLAPASTPTPTAPASTSPPTAPAAGGGSTAGARY
jgi:uncharacterized SAM-binding protein YcdF (DUF218 family)